MANKQELSTLESRNPATCKRLGSVPVTAPGDVEAVVRDVATVQPFWAELPTADRARYMRRTAQVLIDHLSDLVNLLTREQGKPRTEAYMMELLPAIDALHWIADVGPSILADERQHQHQLIFKQKRARIVYEPLGVVAVIAPWNYPWGIPFAEVAIALMCGNGVVLKPSEETPLVGQRIGWAFERAGLPEGLVSVIHGDGETGRALVESSVAKVFFTGSVEAGRDVGGRCAGQLKGCVLELGGKDPMVVLPDAHLEHAISGALWGGFANAGQTCSGIERVYVLREIADRFIDGVVAGARALRVGDPLSPDTEVGPMINATQHGIVADLVDDAVASGAERRCGGPVQPPGLSGSFYAPTVLTGVTHEMRIMREEIFGPVLPIVVVDSEEEAIALANDSEFGLGASVWTLDRPKGERIARRIESGMVWINDHMYSHGACQCAWGGVKSSGIGRSHSRHGFYECTSIKQLVWEPSRTSNVWWHPYDASLGKAAHALAQVIYGRDEDKLKALRRGLRHFGRLMRKSLRNSLRG